MTTWRYQAVEPRTTEIRSNLIDADTSAAARAAIRRAGLKPIEIKEIRKRDASKGALGSWYRRRLRSHRTSTKSDFYDSLSILIDAGVPIVVALQTLGRSRDGRGGVSVLAASLGDDLRAGSTLGQAMRIREDWFDGTETAIIDAGQRAGELTSSLRRLAEKQTRKGELATRLVGALAYPFLVCVVGVGVSLFLSVKTLPELVGILEDAQVEAPALTLWIMDLGQRLVQSGLWIMPITAMIGLLLFGVSRVLPDQTRRRLLRWFVICNPRVFRKSKSAEAMISLAELLETGVTLVESVRVITPTLRGGIGLHLAVSMSTAAEKIEQGEPVGCLFNDPLWFSEEHRQLLRVGEEAGELAEALGKLGELDRRAASRSLDRMTSMLEPASILLLAVFVGMVVMAAVLPLVQLQEIVR